MRTIREIGVFRVGSFGIYPPGRLLGNETMTLWAVEPDHTNHVRECSPALPSGKYLYSSKSRAQKAIQEMEM